jgi:NAD(P)-dependent dehydrogenase (short-subunit alcohol dehydrogenase family)
MKLAVITGASGGLASACVTRLKLTGWQLALISRTVNETTTTDVARWFTADVSEPGEARRVFQEIRESMGTPKGLIHCAGTTLIGPLHKTSAEKFSDCLRANLDSAFYTLQAFISTLSTQKQPGAAVLVSSVVAGIGVTNHAAIAAAKGGVEALTRSAAAEYAPAGIRVNAIAPGLMNSPMTKHMLKAESTIRQISAQYPLGRHGETDDGAAAACWLMSDEASWVTGQIIRVDGGFSAIRPVIRSG